MLLLEGGGRGVLLVHGHLLLGSGLVLNAVGPAVIRDVGRVDDRGLFDDGPVDVDVGYHGAVYVDNGGVVGKGAAIPCAAGKADSPVAAAVVHAAIIADVRSPVACMEAEMAAGIAPVAGGPERAGIRCRHPCAGNPVETEKTVVPVAGRPDQVRRRARRLNINR